MLVKYLIRPLIIRLLINAIALYGVVYFLPGRLEIIGGVSAYLLAAFIIGVLNFFIKPILKLFSLPLLIITLGLFTILINGLIVYLTTEIFILFSSYEYGMIVKGGFISYLIIALVFGILNYLTGVVLKKK